MLDEMARKKDPNLPGRTQTNFRVEQVLLDGLDEMADDLNHEAGWAEYDRSKLLREIIKRALKEHREKKGAPQR